LIAEEVNVARNKVAKFLESFPHDKIARASFNCQNYARALLHYEQHMGDDPIQGHLDTLQVSTSVPMEVTALPEAKEKKTRSLVKLQCN